jgi:hypothetical protein
MANGPYVASLKLPFSQFPGIDPEAARRIWRDFEAVSAALMAVPSIWDAIIDPTLTSSIPSLHQYVNLTELLANETWLTTHTFKVGVKQQRGISISEPATVGLSLSGRGDLALFGLGEPLQDSTHVGWAWQTCGGDAGQQVYLHNLSIGVGSFISSNVLFNGVGMIVTLDGCYIGDGVGEVVGTGAGYAVYANNTTFVDQQFLDSGGLSAQTHHYFDCIFIGGLNISRGITAYIMGGTIGENGGATLTIANSASALVAANIKANLTITGSGSTNIVVNNVGQLGGTVTVSATIPNVTVTGDWSAVSFTGTPTGMRRFVGSGDSNDFTGPGQCDHVNKTGGAGHNVKLRGTGVIANVSILQGVAIQGLSLTHSVIVADYAVASTFLFDASSSNNLAILGGTHVGGWGGTTDSGTSNRIITETSDSLLSGFVTTALTSAHLLVGSAGNVATDTAITGDVTITNAGVTSIGAAKVTNAMLAGLIDLTAKVTGILPVANGGTGIASPTAHKLLVGNGASAMTQLAVGTNGQLLIGQTGADPAWAALTGDITLNAAGATNIISSVGLTGAPTSPSPTAGDVSTKIATTAFVLGGSKTADFTPTYSGSTGSAGTAATSVAGGRYVRNGNQVHFEFVITMSSIGSWTGDLILGGLPYNVTDSTTTMSLGVTFHCDVATGAGNVVSIQARGLLGTKTMKFTYRTAAAASPTAFLQSGAAQTAAGFTAMVQGSYYTNDAF